MTKFANLHRNWRRNRNRNRNLFRNFGLRFRLNHGSRFDGILEQSRVDDLRRLKFKTGLKKHFKSYHKDAAYHGFFGLRRGDGSFQAPGPWESYFIKKEKYSSDKRQVLNMFQGRVEVTTETIFVVSCKMFEMSQSCK